MLNIKWQICISLAHCILNINPDILKAGTTIGKQLR